MSADTRPGSEPTPPQGIIDEAINKLLYQLEKAVDEDIRRPATIAQRRLGWKKPLALVVGVVGTALLIASLNLPKGPEVAHTPPTPITPSRQAAKGAFSSPTVVAKASPEEARKPEGFLIDKGQVAYTASGAFSNLVDGKFIVWVGKTQVDKLSQDPAVGIDRPDNVGLITGIVSDSVETPQDQERALRLVTLDANRKDLFSGYINYASAEKGQRIYWEGGYVPPKVISISDIIKDVYSRNLPARDIDSVIPILSAELSLKWAEMMSVEAYIGRNNIHSGQKIIKGLTPQARAMILANLPLRVIDIDQRVLKAAGINNVK